MKGRCVTYPNHIGIYKYRDDAIKNGGVVHNTWTSARTYLMQQAFAEIDQLKLKLIAAKLAYSQISAMTNKELM